VSKRKAQRSGASLRDGTGHRVRQGPALDARTCDQPVAIQPAAIKPRSSLMAHWPATHIFAVNMKGISRSAWLAHPAEGRQSALSPLDATNQPAPAPALKEPAPFAEGLAEGNTEERTRVLGRSRLSIRAPADYA
jgi:hypothetical protein